MGRSVPGTVQSALAFALLGFVCSYGLALLVRFPTPVSAGPPPPGTTPLWTLVHIVGESNEFPGPINRSFTNSTTETSSDGLTTVSGGGTAGYSFPSQVTPGQGFTFASVFANASFSVQASYTSTGRYSAGANIFCTPDGVISGPALVCASTPLSTSNAAGWEAVAPSFHFATGASASLAANATAPPLTQNHPTPWQWEGWTASVGVSAGGADFRTGLGAGSSAQAAAAYRLYPLPEPDPTRSEFSLTLFGDIPCPGGIGGRCVPFDPHTPPSPAPTSGISFTFNLKDTTGTPIGLAAPNAILQAVRTCGDVVSMVRWQPYQYLTRGPYTYGRQTLPFDRTQPGPWTGYQAGTFAYTWFGYNTLDGWYGSSESLSSTATVTASSTLSATWVGTADEDASRVLVQKDQIWSDGVDQTSIRILGRDECGHPSVGGPTQPVEITLTQLDGTGTLLLKGPVGSPYLLDNIGEFNLPLTMKTPGLWRVSATIGGHTLRTEDVIKVAEASQGVRSHLVIGRAIEYPEADKPKKGVPGASVSLTRTDNASGVTAFTDNYGFYQIDVHDPVTVKLTATKAGYEFTPGNRNTTPGVLQQDFQAQPSCSAAAGARRAAAAGCSEIRGQVVRKTTRVPLANVQITTDTGVAVFTNSDGYFFITRPPADANRGKYKLTGTKKGWTFPFGSIQADESSAPNVMEAVAPLWLEGIEVTQGIQSWENTVPLYAGRDTFVRAQVRSYSGNVDFLHPVLRGERTFTTLKKSVQTAFNLPVMVRDEPNRAFQDGNFQYTLDPDWVAGTDGNLNVTFDGNGRDIACTADDETGPEAKCTTTVFFRKAPELGVQLIPVPWWGGLSFTPVEPTAADMAGVLNEIGARYPVAKINWSIGPRLLPGLTDPTFPLRSQPSNIFDLNRIDGELALRKALDGCIAPPLGSCTEIYLGVLVGRSEGTLGLAEGITLLGSWDVAGGYYVPNNNVFAHEVGHVLGRSHVNCSGKEWGTDRSYPYPNGKISAVSSGLKAFFGFDRQKREPVTPEAGDLMSYCSYTWISDYTYTALADALKLREARGTRSALAATGESLLVSGAIAANGASGSLDPLLVLPEGGESNAEASGTYSIRTQTAGGQTIATYWIGSPAPEDPAVSVTSRTFQLVIPRDSAVTRIALYSGETELAARKASTNAPVVSIVTPTAGQALSGPAAELRWNAFDADGDTLQYLVQISTNAGSTWQTVASSWPSTTLTIDATKLPGAAAAKLRVIATDGFRTGSAESAPFAIDRKAPGVLISQPASGSYVVGNASLALEGSGYDLEDGQLGDSSLTWTSSINGVLGTGPSLVVPGADLSEGVHTITLTGRDGDGQSATAQITVLVARDRASLPAKLSAGPSSLAAFASPGSTVLHTLTLSIRNLGGGTLSWTAASNKPWATLSQTSGTDLADIEIRLDPIGLAAGNYQGQIAVNAGAAGSQIITVQFEIVEPTTSAIPALVYIPSARRP